eukprot:5410724-Amphidinium_carterae.2
MIGPHPVSFRQYNRESSVFVSNSYICMEVLAAAQCKDDCNGRGTCGKDGKCVCGAGLSLQKRHGSPPREHKAYFSAHHNVDGLKAIDTIMAVMSGVASDCCPHDTQVMEERHCGRISRFASVTTTASVVMAITDSLQTQRPPNSGPLPKVIPKLGLNPASHWVQLVLLIPALHLARLVLLEGQCMEGSCLCFAGYFGEDCSHQGCRDCQM